MEGDVKGDVEGDREGDREGMWEEGGMRGKHMGGGI